MKKFLLSVLCLIFVAANVINAKAAIIPAGNDHWITKSEATGELLSVPKGFFGKGSLPYEGYVRYEGNPRSGVKYDTSVRRESPVNVPGTTSIRVVELYMKSVRPLDVMFEDGSVAQCDLLVEVSPSIPSKGTMKINPTTWDSSMTVVPMYKSNCRFGSSLNGRSISTVNDLGTPFMQIYLRNQAKIGSQNMLLGTATDKDKLYASLIPTTKGGVYGAQFTSSKNEWKMERNQFKSITPDAPKVDLPPVDDATTNPCRAGCNYILESNGIWFCHCVQTPLEPHEQIPFADPLK